jgi:hypothetical protein
MPPARNAAEIVLAGLGDEVGVVSAACVAFERIPIAADTTADQDPVGATRG